MRSLIVAVVLAAFSFAPGAVAQVANPPPASAFSGYKAYELKPLVVSDELKSSETGQKATAKIQEHIDTRLAPIIAGWGKMTDGDGNGNTLIFEPAVSDLRFINGTKRFWAGAFAGKSHVVLRMRIVEQPGDRVIAEPEFYRHASGMAGAWTVGGHDNSMLLRVVELAADYLSANHQAAVGGRSGREDEKEEKEKK